MPLLDTVHSLNTPCSFLFSADVFWSGNITERETLITVCIILQYWCAQTRTAVELADRWCRCDQLSSLVCIKVKKKKKKERKKLKMLKRGVSAWQCHSLPLLQTQWQRQMCGKNNGWIWENISLIAMETNPLSLFQSSCIWKQLILHIDLCTYTHIFSRIHQNVVFCNWKYLFLSITG